MPPRLRPKRFSRRTRRIAFASTMAVLIGLIPALTLIGFRASLERRDGRAVSVGQSPDSAGYQALVTPTPTLLLVQENAEQEAVSFTLAALGSAQGGGAVVFLPTATLAPGEGQGPPRPLTELWRSGGEAAVKAGVETLFNAAIDRVETVGRDELSALVAPVAPLRVPNAETLVTLDRNGRPQVRFRGDPIVLPAADAALFLEIRNPGEAEPARLYRHEQFWRSWLGALGRTAAPGEEGAVAAFVRRLAAGAVDYPALPVAPVEPLASAPARSEVSYQVDQRALPGFVAGVIPFPVGPTPGARLRVRLLDGRGERVVTLGAAQRLVPLGAEITIFGNADRFDYDASEVVFYDPAKEAQAAGLAQALGVAAPSLADVTDENVDVTVLIGADYRAP